MKAVKILYFRCTDNTGICIHEAINIKSSIRRVIALSYPLKHLNTINSFYIYQDNFKDLYIH